MRELDTLIKAIQKEKEQAIDCQSLNVAKKDNEYNAYLRGKEEAFTLTLLLLREFEKTLENNN